MSIFRVMVLKKKYVKSWRKKLGVRVKNSGSSRRGSGDDCDADLQPSPSAV